MLRPLFLSAFVVVFVISLVATAPASLLPVVTTMPMENPGDMPISGTIWKGQIGGLVFDNDWTGLLSLKMRGALRYDLGAVRGFGHYEAGMFSAVEGLDHQIVVDMSRIALPLPLVGGLHIDIQSLRLAPNGACVSVLGSATSDMLQRSGERLNLPGPSLAGPVSCTNGAVHINLTGSAGDQNMQVILNVFADGSLQGNMMIHNSAKDQALLLEPLGFRQFGSSVNLPFETRWRK